jgi:hypothetical protein
MVYDDSTLTSLLKTMPGLTSGNTYYWRVNAKNPAGTSNYSTVWHFTTGAGALGSASTFGIAAWSALTNTGNSVINGDVSLNPGTSITGFTFSPSPGPGVVNGSVHVNDGVSSQVYTDLHSAYIFAKGLPVGTTVPDGQDLGAWQPTGSILPAGTLPPGVYTNGSTMSVNTPLILDAQGDANAIWVFQIGSSLTTFTGAPGGNVTLTVLRPRTCSGFLLQLQLSEWALLFMELYWLVEMSLVRLAPRYSAEYWVVHSVPARLLCKPALSTYLPHKA